MKVLSYVSGVRVSDTQTGLRGIPRAFMRDLLDVPGERFEFETQMLLETAGRYPIEEVPIRTIYDSKENHQTHFNPLKDSVRIYRILGAKFIKYLFASLSSCVIDLVLFALFCRLLKGAMPTAPAPLNRIPYVAAATILARVLSATYNFTMNYKVVFRSREKVGGSAAKYIALALVQMLLSAVLVTGGTALLPMLPEVLVKAVVDTVLFLVSYYVQRKYVF
jgi:putative flippase GtrA